MAIDSCSIIILNYNGQRHLDDCLSSVLAAVEAFGKPCPVVVVDNQSTEGDAAYIRSRFPIVEVQAAEKNDFLFSLNDVVAARPEEAVILLNNDMRFDRDFIRPLLLHFDDPEVFAATAKVTDWEGRRVSTGKRVGVFRNFWFYKYWDGQGQGACWTLDAGGGCAAFRRSAFVELGGFDPLYRPAYWEDTDLSYRAWQRGWKIIYEPSSVMHHRIAATLDEMYGRPKMTRLIERNGVLFTVKNCGGFFFLLAYLFLLPIRALNNYIKGNKSLSCGIVDALPGIPLALKKRRESFRARRVSEKTFLRRIKEEE